MRDEFLDYYERELTFLRRIGAQFAEQYPKVAGRLLLEPEKCEDPNVERLLEGFAFLAARIHLRLDDDFPEISESLLNSLCPHYLAPIPSMSVAEFQVDPRQTQLTSGHTIPAGTDLRTPPVRGTRCRFHTSYPVTLWPLRVADAEYVLHPEQTLKLPAGSGAQAALRIVLETTAGTDFADLEMDRLRFYLAGEGRVTHALLEQVLANTIAARMRSVGGKREGDLELGESCVGAVGFEPDEGVIPYPKRSFVGYRLLSELFAFPEKFLFFDVANLEGCRELGGNRLEIILLFDRAHEEIEGQVRDTTLRLGATPIVNLFSQVAEPIRVTHTVPEYLIVPDQRRRREMEIYSVDHVAGVDTQTRKSFTYRPIHAHRVADEDAPEVFWSTSRRRSHLAGDEGTEVYISFIDPSFRPTRPREETVTVRATCSNRDLAGRLPIGREGGDLEMEGSAPITAIRFLHKPTPTQRPPLRQGTRWRLISHLSLNYLSLEDDGAERMREMLRLYDYGVDRATRQRIAGLTALRCTPLVRRVHGHGGSAFCRGVGVELELDDEAYVGGGEFLFAAVLERFLSMYVSVNSFVELTARSRQRGVLKRWPPRAGNLQLI